jgi:hypothetical protein
MPLASTISISTGDVVVTFDQALQPGPTDKFNWTVKADVTTGPKTRTIALDGTILGSTVTLATVLGSIAFPPLGVTYNAGTPDVLGLTGAPAAAFADLPISTIP